MREIVAVHQQHALQHRKVGERKVGAQRRLSALLAHNAEADVRLLDHRHIVRTVANGTGNRGARRRFHQLHHLAFLQRTEATAEHRPAAHRHVAEAVACVTQRRRQTGAVDQQREDVVGLALRMGMGETQIIHALVFGISVYRHLR